MAALGGRGYRRAVLPSCRDLFEIPDDVAYLNCAYMAPLPTAARRAGESGLAQKATPWDLSPSDFFEAAERIRRLFAELVSATADDIALVPAVSYGTAVAAANLPVARGQNILVLAEQFPSNVYPWRERARTAGAKVLSVARPDDHDWTAAVLERIDSGTAIVALPAVHWADGTAFDLVSIRRRADEVGAALVLDLAQSCGVMPFDVREVRPDFMVAPTYKWLLGPYSMGFLYVSPKWQGGVPLEHNWIVRAGSEDFAGLVSYRDEYQPGARRFDVGERANFALVPVVEAALRQLLAWGVPAIYETLGRGNRALAERLAAFGFSAVPENRRAGHYLGLRRARGLPDDLVPRLAAERVYVSRRGSCLRVTPHLYNDEGDFERLLHALERIPLP